MKKEGIKTRVENATRKVQDHDDDIRTDSILTSLYEQGRIKALRGHKPKIFRGAPLHLSLIHISEPTRPY